MQLATASSFRRARSGRALGRQRALKGNVCPFRGCTDRLEAVRIWRVGHQGLGSRRVEMTMKPVDQPTTQSGPPNMPVLDVNALPNDLTGQVKFSGPADEDMLVIAALRATSEPWKGR